MNSACDCCSPPPPFRVAIQFASFNRSCSNFCFLGSVEDWLTGPWRTKIESSGSVSRSVELNFNEYTTYKASYERSTSSYLEFESELVGVNRGGASDNFICPCSNGYSQSDNSSYEEVGTGTSIDEEGNEIDHTITTSMECNVASGCSFECPPQTIPENDVVFGVPSQGSITQSFSSTLNPESNYSETTNFTCENPSNCPVPQFITDAIPTPTTTYSGESAMCLFEDEQIQFPSFKNIIKLTPLNDSGFVQIETNEPQENQGYSSQTYRFARCNNGRCIDQSEQHVQWRVVHNPTISCYLKIWFIKKIIVTKSGGSSGYTPLPTEIYWVDAGTYVWDGSTKQSNRCVNNSSEIYDIENIIYGPTNTMAIPMPNTQNREWGISEEIYIKKVSAIEGYEPPDPDTPEGDPNYWTFFDTDYAGQDISFDSTTCLRCGGKSARCPYKFIQELTEPEGGCI